MGIGEGTRAGLGDGGILMGPRGAGGQAEGQGERKFIRLSIIWKLSLSQHIYVCHLGARS